MISQWYLVCICISIGTSHFHGDCLALYLQSWFNDFEYLQNLHVKSVAILISTFALLKLQKSETYICDNSLFYTGIKYLLISKLIIIVLIFEPSYPC